MKRLLLFCLASLATIASSAQVGAKTWPVPWREPLRSFVDKQVNKPIFVMHDTLLFTTNIEMHIDGSPRADRCSL